MASLCPSITKKIEARCFDILSSDPAIRKKHTPYYKDEEPVETRTYIGRTFNPNISYKGSSSGKGNITVQSSSSVSMSRIGPNLSGFSRS
jgi:hypothetical protein